MDYSSYKYHKRSVLKTATHTCIQSHNTSELLSVQARPTQISSEKGVLKTVTPTSRSSYFRIVISLSVQARPTKMAREQWFFSAIIWRSIKNGPIIVEATFSFDGNIKWTQFNLA